MPAAHHKEPLPGDTLSCPRNWAGLTKLAGGSLAPSRTRCPSAQHSPLPDKPRCALFPFSASGTGLPAEAGGAGGLAVRGLAETRAPCDSLCEKGGPECQQAAPEAGRANSSENPFGKHQNPPKDVVCSSPCPVAFHPVSPLCTARPGPHLRPCQGLATSHFPHPRFLSSISSLTFLRPQLG